MAIWTVLKANIKKKKGSFISILMLTLIISIAISTISSSILCGKERYRNANKEANSADITNFVLKAKYDENMKKSLEEQEEIDSVEELDAIGYEKLEICGKEDSGTTFLCPYDAKKHVYKLENSNNNDIPKDGEIYLPYAFKNKYDCKVGMQIEFKAGDKVYTYTVADFFEDPIYGSEEITMKRILMNQKDLDEISNCENSELIPFVQVNTYIKDSYKKENSVSKIIYDINKATGIENYGEVCSTLKVYEGYTLSLSNIIGAILLGFCMLLFLIVIIVVAYSISSNVEMEYTELGIMKAIGFNNKDMRLILIIQYILSGAVGCVIGLILSILLIKPVGKFLLTSTGLLWEGKLKLGICLSILVGMLVILIFFTFLVTRKVTKISPVRAITFGRAPVYFSSKLTIPLSKLTWMPLSVKIALKQIVSYAKHYFMLFIVVGVLVSSIISISSMDNMFRDHDVAILFGKITSDIKISYNKENKYLEDDMLEYVRNKATVTESFKLDSYNRAVDDTNLLVKVIDDNSTNVLPDTLEGRNPKFDNEVVITEVISDLLQKRVGDYIEITADDGSEQEYMICGLNQSMSNAGKNITMLESGMKRLEDDFEINTIQIRINEDDKIDDIIDDLNDKYSNLGVDITNSYKNNKDDMEEKINAINIATKSVYFIAIVVVGVVCLLVSNKTLQREQIDIGILKAEGFTTKQLRIQFILRFLIVSIVGSLFGVALNLMINDHLMSFLFRYVGISRFVTIYYLKTLLEPVFIVSLFTCLFSWLVTKKIKKVTPKNLIQE